MNAEMVSWAWKIGVVLFAAGGGWTAAQIVAKQTRKDVNGLGNKQRDQEFRNWTLAMLTVALEEDAERRKWLAQYILDAARRRQ